MENSEILVFKTGIKRSLFYFFLSLFVILILLPMLFFGNFTSYENFWIYTGLFFTTIAFILAVASFFPNFSYLKLTKSGFVLKYFLQKRVLKWDDISAFGLFYYNANTSLCVNYSQEFINNLSTVKQLGIEVNRRIYNYDDYLSISFLKNSPDEIFSALSQWREKYSTIKNEQV